MTMDEVDDRKSYLKTVGKGVLVLEMLGAQGPLSLQDLARRMELNRSTAYRLVNTFVAHGLVRRDPTTDKYRLGPKMWTLGLEAVDLNAFQGTLGALVQTLAHDYGESVHLAIYDAGDVVYIDKADGWQPITSYSRRGGRAPAYCVATGKSLLAELPDVVVEELIASGLTRHTPMTITDPAELRRELALSKARGYAANRGEWRAAVGGVATAVREPVTGELYSIGFSGPIDRIQSKQAELTSVLIKSCGELSDNLSGH